MLQAKWILFEGFFHKIHKVVRKHKSKFPKLNKKVRCQVVEYPGQTLIMNKADSN